MAISTAQIPVGTAPVEFTMVPGDGFTGSSVLIKAPANATLYIGGPDVTPANGFPVPPDSTISGDMQTSGDQLYGVLASGTGTAYVLRSGV